MFDALTLLAIAVAFLLGSVFLVGVLLGWLFCQQWQTGFRPRLAADAVDLPRLHVVQDQPLGTGVLVVVRTLREFTEESDGVTIPANTRLWCSLAEARWLAQMSWAWPQWVVEEP